MADNIKPTHLEVSFDNDRPKMQFHLHTSVDEICKFINNNMSFVHTFVCRLNEEHSCKAEVIDNDNQWNDELDKMILITGDEDRHEAKVEIMTPINPNTVLE